MFKNFLILTIIISSINFAKANDEHHANSPKPDTLISETKHTKESPKKEAEQAHESNKQEHHREKGAVEPSKSLTWLQNGNLRFTKGNLRRDGAGSKDRERLATGQKPHAIVLSCSDSRVPPEVLFDQKLGEIFVVRTAGQAIDFSAIASIEYAVSHLGSNLIIIMGHESCGAVKAALGTLKGGDAGSIWLNQLVKDLHPRLKRFTDLTPTDNVLVESWVNVEGTESELLEKSELIKELVNRGDIKIQKALYHLSSGKVEWR